MIKLYIYFLLIKTSTSLFSQQQEYFTLKPICRIHITTVNGNMLKGLLIMTHDSVVVVYPGKRSEWNKNKEYRAAVYGYSKIRRILIKKNGRVMKGISLGAAIGSLPLFAGLGKNEKDAIARISAITLPAGMLAGALLGYSAKKKFYINASGSSFHEFQNQIQ